MFLIKILWILYSHSIDHSQHKTHQTRFSVLGIVLTHMSIKVFVNEYRRFNVKDTRNFIGSRDEPFGSTIVPMTYN